MTDALNALRSGADAEAQTALPEAPILVTPLPRLSASQLFTLRTV